MDEEIEQVKTDVEEDSDEEFLDDDVEANQSVLNVLIEMLIQKGVITEHEFKVKLDEEGLEWGDQEVEVEVEEDEEPESIPEPQSQF